MRCDSVACLLHARCQRYAQASHCGCDLQRCADRCYAVTFAPAGKPHPHSNSATTAPARLVAAFILRAGCIHFGGARVPQSATYCHYACVLPSPLLTAGAAVATDASSTLGALLLTAWRVTWCTLGGRRGMVGVR